ncbi:hypothetical protein D3C86_2008160 [compost metagenome]
MSQDLFRILKLCFIGDVTGTGIDLTLSRFQFTMMRISRSIGQDKAYRQYLLRVAMAADLEKLILTDIEIGKYGMNIGYGGEQGIGGQQATLFKRNAVYYSIEW